VTPLECALAVSRALENAGVDYAIGGALAYGIYAVPRATADVDLNVFVRNADLERVVAAVVAEGGSLALDEARAAADADGLIVVFIHSIRVDLFVPSIPFSWEAHRTRLGFDFDGRVVYFLSPAALAVFKMLFFRPKDLVDLERLLALQGADSLDRGYVRGQIVEMLGDDDERVSRWDDLVRADDSRRGTTPSPP